MSVVSHPIPIFFVDAFTTNGKLAFTGNPAAVCFLDYDDDVSDDLKQKIAAEINQSETAFVSNGWTKDERLSVAEGSSLYRRTLRWFTPSNETELCGHATLASTKAFVTQFSPELSDNVTVSFESKFWGKLGAVWKKDGNGEERITLNFPANPSHVLSETAEPWLPEMIDTVLGKDVPKDVICDIQYSPKTKILMLRLRHTGVSDRAELMKKVSPNFQKLLEVKTGTVEVNDLIVTIKGEGNGKPDFHSRFFAPWDGNDEDPVTGLAHTVLTPYWTKELEKEVKGMETVGTLLGRQESARGGHVYCTLVGDRVTLAGTAKITIKGEMVV